MAVVLTTKRNRYIGQSTDTKPTGVPVGSTFEETDTKDVYTTADGTNWVKAARNSKSNRTASWRKNS